MFLDRVDEIHVTTVHVSNSGSITFPQWDRSDWSENVIEQTIADEVNDHATTYSIWTKS